MLIALLRKFLLTLITLIILSMISYNILLRDPLNSLNGIGVMTGYFRYVASLLQADLGISYINGEPLTVQVLSVFPATITLCVAALLLSLLIGLPLGFWVAYIQKSTLGKVMTWLGSLSFSMPVFWLALLLLYSASINRWEIAAVGDLHPIYAIQPLTGFRILDILSTDSPYQLKMMQSALHHLILPTLVLGIPSILEVMRFTQERANYVMKQNYIKVAQTRGWSAFRIFCSHVLGNSLPALIPTIARHFTVIFAFGMLIENIFSWGGIGRWLINALAEQDYNAISAGVVVIGGFVLLIDLFTSFLKTLLDPSQKKDWYTK